MSNVPLPEPDISVPFLSEVRKVYQGDYYRADKVLPLLKQWAALYEVAKAGHEQAFAEAQNAAAVSAADNAALRERVKVLEAALNAMLTHMGMDEDEWNKPTFDQARSALEQKP